jgi:RND family efflux transporter MFP subunit
VKFFRLLLQILLPIAVVVGGLWLARTIASTRRDPVVVPTVFRGPIVRVETATTTDLQLHVDTQGTVEAARTVDLGAQVGGRITAVAASLRAGGFFAAGDTLATIDDADHRLAIVQREAAIARAELRVLQERAEATAAVRAWKELEGDLAADPLVTRGPQIRDAEAALAAAKAQLDRARLDLERTAVKAPFAGRVRAVLADLGQTVNPGQAIARVDDVEFAEIALPIAAAEAAFLDLPLPGSSAAPPVELVAEFGGRRHTWQGTVVRTGGEIDRRTRQLTLIARVEHPYERQPQADRPPLAVGTFVQARVTGRKLTGVVVIPRRALHDGDVVWLVDAEHRLRARTVEVLRIEADRVVLRAGLPAGARLCTSPIEAPLDGTPVRIADEPAPAPAGVAPQSGRGQ